MGVVSTRSKAVRAIGVLGALGSALLASCRSYAAQCIDGGSQSQGLIAYGTGGMAGLIAYANACHDRALAEMPQVLHQAYDLTRQAGDLAVQQSDVCLKAERYPLDYAKCLDAAPAIPPAAKPLYDRVFARINGTGWALAICETYFEREKKAKAASDPGNVADTADPCDDIAGMGAQIDAAAIALDTPPPAAAPPATPAQETKPASAPNRTTAATTPTTANAQAPPGHGLDSAAPRPGAPGGHSALDGPDGFDESGQCGYAKKPAASPCASSASPHGDAESSIAMVTAVTQRDDTLAYAGRYLALEDMRALLQRLRMENDVSPDQLKQIAQSLASRCKTDDPSMQPITAELAKELGRMASVASYQQTQDWNLSHGDPADSLDHPERQSYQDRYARKAVLAAEALASIDQQLALLGEDFAVSPTDVQGSLQKMGIDPLGLSRMLPCQAAFRALDGFGDWTKELLADYTVAQGADGKRHVYELGQCTKAYWGTDGTGESRAQKKVDKHTPDMIRSYTQADERFLQPQQVYVLNSDGSLKLDENGKPVMKTEQLVKKDTYSRRCNQKRSAMMMLLRQRGALLARYPELGERYGADGKPDASGKPLYLGLTERESDPHQLRKIAVQQDANGGAHLVSDPELQARSLFQDRVSAANSSAVTSQLQSEILSVCKDPMSAGKKIFADPNSVASMMACKKKVTKVELVDGELSMKLSEARAKMCRELYKNGDLVCSLASEFEHKERKKEEGAADLSLVAQGIGFLGDLAGCFPETAEAGEGEAGAGELSAEEQADLGELRNAARGAIAFRMAKAELGRLGHAALSPASWGPAAAQIAAEYNAQGTHDSQLNTGLYYAGLKSDQDYEGDKQALQAMAWEGAKSLVVNTIKGHLFGSGQNLVEHGEDAFNRDLYLSEQQRAATNRGIDGALGEYRAAVERLGDPNADPTEARARVDAAAEKVLKLRKQQLADELGISYDQAGKFLDGMSPEEAIDYAQAVHDGKAGRGDDFPPAEAKFLHDLVTDGALESADPRRTLEKLVALQRELDALESSHQVSDPALLKLRGLLDAVAEKVYKQFNPNGTPGSHAEMMAYLDDVLKQSVASDPHPAELGPVRAIASVGPGDPKVGDVLVDPSTGRKVRITAVGPTEVTAREVDGAGFARSISRAELASGAPGTPGHWQTLEAAPRSPQAAARLARSELLNLTQTEEAALDKDSGLRSWYLAQRSEGGARFLLGTETLESHARASPAVGDAYRDALGTEKKVVAVEEGRAVLRDSNTGATESVPIDELASPTGPLAGYELAKLAHRPALELLRLAREADRLNQSRAAAFAQAQAGGIDPQPAETRTAVRPAPAGKGLVRAIPPPPHPLETADGVRPEGSLAPSVYQTVEAANRAAAGAGEPRIALHDEQIADMARRDPRVGDRFVNPLTGREMEIVKVHEFSLQVRDVQSGKVGKVRLLDFADPTSEHFSNNVPTHLAPRTAADLQRYYAKSLLRLPDTESAALGKPPVSTRYPQLAAWYENQRNRGDMAFRPSARDLTDFSSARPAAGDVYAAEGGRELHVVKAGDPITILEIDPHAVPPRQTRSIPRSELAASLSRSSYRLDSLAPREDPAELLEFLRRREQGRIDRLAGAQKDQGVVSPAFRQAETELADARVAFNKSATPANQAALDAAKARVAAARGPYDAAVAQTEAAMISLLAGYGVDAHVEHGKGWDGGDLVVVDAASSDPGNFLVKNLAGNHKLAKMIGGGKRVNLSVGFDPSCFDAEPRFGGFYRKADHLLVMNEKDMSAVACRGICVHELVHAAVANQDFTARLEPGYKPTAGATVEQVLKHASALGRLLDPVWVVQDPTEFSGSSDARKQRLAGLYGSQFTMDEAVSASKDAAGASRKELGHFKDSLKSLRDKLGGDPASAAAARAQFVRDQQLALDPNRQPLRDYDNALAFAEHQLDLMNRALTQVPPPKVTFVDQGGKKVAYLPVSLGGTPPRYAWFRFDSPTTRRKFDVPDALGMPKDPYLQQLWWNRELMVERQRELQQARASYVAEVERIGDQAQAAVLARGSAERARPVAAAPTPPGRAPAGVGPRGTLVSPAPPAAAPRASSVPPASLDSVPAERARALRDEYQHTLLTLGPRETIFYPRDPSYHAISGRVVEVTENGGQLRIRVQVPGESAPRTLSESEVDFGRSYAAARKSAKDRSPAPVRPSNDSDARAVAFASAPRAAGGAPLAAPDLAAWSSAYPESVEQHDASADSDNQITDSTPVYRYAGRADGLGESGVTSWRTGSPDPSRANDYLFVSTVGELRRQGADIRVDRLDPGNGPGATVLTVANHSAWSRVPGDGKRVAVAAPAREPAFQQARVLREAPETAPGVEPGADALRKARALFPADKTEPAISERIRQTSGLQAQRDLQSAEYNAARTMTDAWRDPAAPPSERVRATVQAVIREAWDAKALAAKADHLVDLAAREIASHPGEYASLPPEQARAVAILRVLTHELHERYGIDGATIIPEGCCSSSADLAALLKLGRPLVESTGNLGNVTIADHGLFAHLAQTYFFADAIEKGMGMGRDGLRAFLAEMGRDPKLQIWDLLFDHSAGTITNAVGFMYAIGERIGLPYSRANVAADPEFRNTFAILSEPVPGAQNRLPAFRREEASADFARTFSASQPAQPASLEARRPGVYARLSAIEDSARARLGIDALVTEATAQRAAEGRPVGTDAPLLLGDLRRAAAAVKENVVAQLDEAAAGQSVEIAAVYQDARDGISNPNPRTKPKKADPDDGKPFDSRSASMVDKATSTLGLIAGTLGESRVGVLVGNVERSSTSAQGISEAYFAGNPRASAEIRRRLAAARASLKGGDPRTDEHPDALGSKELDLVYRQPDSRVVWGEVKNFEKPVRMKKGEFWSLVDQVRSQQVVAEYLVEAGIYPQVDHKVFLPGGIFSDALAELQKRFPGVEFVGSVYAPPPKGAKAMAAL
jgi:hypothetical protein